MGDIVYSIILLDYFTAFYILIYSFVDSFYRN
ncbi:hypothetical protein FHS70_000734 [Flammeovirga yaeyamensis]|nr:hypothetical protein [Flammeovirga yaeyamensis]